MTKVKDLGTISVPRNCLLWVLETFLGCVNSCLASFYFIKDLKIANSLFVDVFFNL